MGFTTKKVQQKTRGISFIKWATLFFLGTSCVLFVARAFDITPSVPNAVQYIQQIFLTTSGANTPGTNRISLDGINGNGTFSGTVSANTISGTNIKGTTITGSTICLAGDTCITQWPAGGTSYTLPVANPTTTGGVKASNDIAVSGTGVMSITSGYVNLLTAQSISGEKTFTDSLTVSGNIKLQNSWWINAGWQTMMLRLDGTNGRIGIGILNPSSQLDVAGGDGTVTAVKYLYNSDKRLKTDISSISDPLSKILSLNGYMFTWKKTGAKDMWVIAQEVEKVFPEIVHTNNEWYKSVEYGNLVAPLIEAIKALNTKIDAQAKEIAALKAKK